MLGSAPDDSRHLIEDAEKRAALVLAVTPDNVDALTDLGFAELRLGQKDDATRHLQAALDKLPEDLRAAMALAAVELAENNRSGAEQVLKNQAEAVLAKKDPKSPRAADAQIALGRFYVALGKVSDAEAAFNRTLAIDPTNAPALIDLRPFNWLPTVPRMQEKLIRGWLPCQISAFARLTLSFFFSKESAKQPSRSSSRSAPKIRKIMPSASN